MQRFPRTVREAFHRIPGLSTCHALTRATVSNPTKEFFIERRASSRGGKAPFPRDSAIQRRTGNSLSRTRPRVATANCDVSHATLTAKDDERSDTSAMKVFNWFVSCPDVRTIPRSELAINGSFVVREFFGDSPLSVSADSRAPDNPASIRRGSGLVERGEPAGIRLRRVRSRVSKPEGIRFRFTRTRHRSRRVSVAAQCSAEAAKGPRKNEPGLFRVVRGEGVWLKSCPPRKKGGGERASRRRCGETS